ncbi:MAG: hypothetical protein ACM3NO_00555 [Deltaproteobacteria bacterium]
MKAPRKPKRKSGAGDPSVVKGVYSRPRQADFLPSEWTVIRKHRTPQSVQSYLNHLPYNRERNGETLRTFRGVVAHGETHCLEAALSAATILEQHGYRPWLLDLESQDNLDHVLFLFKHRGRWGTVARSRDMALHGRKPVFRTVRQLVMSYVDPYVDGSGRITGYGVFDLRQLGKYDWRLSRKNVWAVERALIEFPHKKIKTSDRRHKRTLERFLAFRKKHPHRPALFYSNRRQWMGIPRPKFRT